MSGQQAELLTLRSPEYGAGVLIITTRKLVLFGGGGGNYRKFCDNGRFSIPVLDIANCVRYMPQHYMTMLRILTLLPSSGDNTLKMDAVPYTTNIHCHTKKKTPWF
jgi:hypothetical protein